jgi:tetratricopeptide (TPR) repeat protein
MGNLDKAIETIEKVVKAAPTVPVFRYHLGMAYYKQGNIAEAKTHLAKAIETKESFVGIDEARATYTRIP